MAMLILKSLKLDRADKIDASGDSRRYDRVLKPDRADTTYAGGDNHRYDSKKLIEAWRADTRHA
jgi:hypothetical protein